MGWFADVRRANWRGPQDIKTTYPNASILDNERVVFNISGNRYRVIVVVRYTMHNVYIRFIGTHAAYSKIDARTI